MSASGAAEEFGAVNRDPEFPFDRESVQWVLEICLRTLESAGGAQIDGGCALRAFHVFVE